MRKAAKLPLDFTHGIRYNKSRSQNDMPVCRNGRRGGLKIPCANNTCGFDPHHRHKKETLQLVWRVSFLSAACERVEQHSSALQGVDADKPLYAVLPMIQLHKVHHAPQDSCPEGIRSALPRFHDVPQGFTVDFFA